MQERKCLFVHLRQEQRSASAAELIHRVRQQAEQAGDLAMKRTLPLRNRFVRTHHIGEPGWIAKPMDCCTQEARFGRLFETDVRGSNDVDRQSIRPSVKSPRVERMTRS